ncbi:hypothetical protein LTR56_018456 [Elasticomyces elasticus]|nr:hypothetical protein LTR56_018456 [Elasticomyces elasticus]KAK3631708.1 hypothetical protein LTR22_020946 [Elasticomyces elasticus]KAK4908400.1 hypothetical protein LTR49_022713 [Elasticomyces elasticus]KAK5751728.1 hypothetical protein LTS12_018203 [Elasticomyces elasticus]
MTLAETQKRTAEDFIRGYNEWTLEGLLRARSDDCVHVTLPASLGRPNRTNEDYREFFKPLSHMISELKMEILNFVNDSDQHKAVVHAKGAGESLVGPYRNEYAFFFDFNADGTKVVRAEEFVDSAFSNGFSAKLEEYMKARNGKSAGSQDG